jgi:hypothetical protein
MPDPKKKAIKKELFGASKDTIAPKRGSKDYNVNDVIESRTKSNLAKARNEVFAKNDSISASRTAKSQGKDLVDQRRAGNNAANISRKKNGVPLVKRYRQSNAGDNADKYSPSGSLQKTRDSYIRDSSVEKDMPTGITAKETDQARRLTNAKNQSNGYNETINAALFSGKKKK